MTKITDDDYTLPYILPLYESKVFRTGRNAPMLIRGLCSDSHEKGDYVIKYIGAPEMSKESSMRELLAAFIAKQLGLHVVEPVIINIKQDFIGRLTAESLEQQNLAQSLGFNYGSVYLKGQQILSHNYQLSNSQYMEAIEIFVFDLLIENIDRRQEKPNMFSDGKHIYIFDHELAFSYTKTLFPSPEPWKFSGPSFDWIKKHFFYPYFKKEEESFEPLIERMSQLDDEFWEKAQTLIPNTWQSDEFQKIREHTENIIQNKSLFTESIRGILQ